MKNTIRDLERKRSQLERALATAPRDLANEALNYTRQRFRQEDWDGRKWAPRQRDSQAGQRRAARRGLLVKTGRLLRGNRIGNVSPRSFTLANSVPYAQPHNEGATIDHPGGSPYLRGGKGKIVYIRKSTARRMGRRVKTTKPHQIPLPERRFIGQSRRLSAILRKQFITITQKAIS